MHGLVQTVIETTRRVAELERRVAGMIRHGPIAEVDPAAGTVRLDLGAATGGGRVLSPAIPYSQMAGALKAHVPPSVGQQMTIVAPSGDWRQAVAVPLTWSDQNEAPSSSGSENVLTYGDATITLKAASLRVEIGGVAFEVSDEGVTITGGQVRHNGKNIGATHVHGGVEPGPANTGVPAN